MPDSGGIEAAIYWESDAGDISSREPSMEIVAVPIDEDNEAIEVQGGLIRIQVKRSKVNDNDLDYAKLNWCSGYLIVYPGYISKQMEPPKDNVRTYWIEWCTLRRDEEDYFITMRYTGYYLGASPDFFWGRFG